LLLFFKKEGLPSLIHRASIGRRPLLFAGLATLGVGWSSALRSRAAGPGLLQSYEVAGNAAFDRTQAGCAYVYDNALAGLALLALGDIAGASRLGEALLSAQARDRFWHDGRLRNAYRAGPVPAAGPYPLPGWWDPSQSRWLEDGYQVGTATGVVAWAMLFWIGLARATGDGRFRAAAGKAGDWVETHVRTTRGYAGGFLGFEPAPQRLTWISTEHNIDLAAAFAALGRNEPASHARSCVASMWNAEDKRFFTGLRPDGGINDHSAVDANLWPLLAAGATAEWRQALDWVLSRHGVPAGHPQGVDFNTDRDGIWLEGTAITALTCRLLDRPEPAAAMLATLAAQTAPSGLIYACTTPSLTTGLSTGLDTSAPDFLYFRRPHIAPTAWAILAQRGNNPFPA
jgi:hypothetical protein